MQRRKALGLFPNFSIPAALQKRTNTVLIRPDNYRASDKRGVEGCQEPLNRDSIWRILKAEGLHRRPPSVSSGPAKGAGHFKEYDLGFLHSAIKHLPKLQTSNGEKRKRYLSVAMDRCSRSVHLAVKEDETEKSALALLQEEAAAFPFPLTPVLADNGSCFTPAFAKACAELGAWWSASTAESVARCWA